METNTGKDRGGFFLEMFSQDGKISAMRVLITFIIIVIMLNWSYLCILSGTMVEFSWQELVVLISPLFAKAMQKRYEK